LNTKLALAGLLLAWPALLVAETAYVTDILRLGIHRVEDTSDAPFRNLVSGTELEVLERTPNYARVQTADGEIGWVKSAYLVLDKPAQLRVVETQAALAALREEADRSNAARHAAEQELAQLSQQIDASTASTEAIEATLTRLNDENEAYEARLDLYRHSVPMLWVLGALGVALIGGFIGGLAWVDYSSRRRHGGFRVY
jgi:SH3 domain protein